MTMYIRKSRSTGVGRGRHQQIHKTNPAPRSSPVGQLVEILARIQIALARGDEKQIWFLAEDGIEKFENR
jgi:hypothetical protein